MLNEDRLKENRNLDYILLILEETSRMLTSKKESVNKVQTGYQIMLKFSNAWTENFEGFLKTPKVW